MTRQGPSADTRPGVDEMIRAATNWTGREELAARAQAIRDQTAERLAERIAAERRDAERETWRQARAELAGALGEERDTTWPDLLKLARTMRGKR